MEVRYNGQLHYNDGYSYFIGNDLIQVGNTILTQSLSIREKNTTGLSMLNKY